MSKKFTVIDTHNEKINKFKEDYDGLLLWSNYYVNTVKTTFENNKDKDLSDYPQEGLMKMAFAGVKFVIQFRNIKRVDKRLDMDIEKCLSTSNEVYRSIDALFNICSHLTLRNFVRTFPITKQYDGEKWECKDYFYTMEALSEMDWDKPIGRENILELLWDYHNHDLSNTYLEFMCAISDIRRSQTGKSIMEEFLEDSDIPSYTFNEKSGVMSNNQTGEIMKVKKSSHLKLVK